MFSIWKNFEANFLMRVIFNFGYLKSCGGLTLGRLCHVYSNIMARNISWKVIWSRLAYVCILCYLMEVGHALLGRQRILQLFRYDACAGGFLPLYENLRPLENQV